MILTHKPFCGLLKPVMLGNKVLDFGTETKCLGIIIDNQMSWLSHLELICRSFGQKVNQLKRFKYLTKGYLAVYLLQKYYSHLQFSLGYLLTYIIAGPCFHLRSESTVLGGKLKGVQKTQTLELRPKNSDLLKKLRPPRPPRPNLENSDLQKNSDQKTYTTPSPPHPPPPHPSPKNAFFFLFLDLDMFLTSSPTFDKVRKLE